MLLVTKNTRTSKRNTVLSSVIGLLGGLCKFRSISSVGFVVGGNCITIGKRNIGQVLTDTIWCQNCADVDIRGGQITSLLGGIN